MDHDLGVWGSLSCAFLLCAFPFDESGFSFFIILELVLSMNWLKPNFVQHWRQWIGDEEVCTETPSHRICVSWEQGWCLEVRKVHTNLVWLSLIWRILVWIFLAPEDGGVIKSLEENGEHVGIKKVSLYAWKSIFQWSLCRRRWSILYRSFKSRRVMVDGCSPFPNSLI